MEVGQFKHQSKQDWIQLAEKSLKGESLETIQLEVEPGFVLDPLYTDSEQYEPIRWRSNVDSWKIVERFCIKLDSDLHQVNTKILDSLKGGCQVLELDIQPACDINPEILLKDVMLDLIEVRVKTDAMERFEVLQASTLQFADQDYISFSIGEDEKHVSESLRDIVQRIEQYFTTHPKASWDSIILNIPIKNHILIEISKIRALKLLVFALAQKLNRPLDVFPIISARIQGEAIQEELEIVIERGNKAMAAVFGGVDEIYIDWKFRTEMGLRSEDKRRVIRNIQWLIKKESHLGLINDPLNGSYWIEQCTQGLVERTWNKFKTGGEG